MKKLLFLLVALVYSVSAAQAQSAETQSLAKRLNQLMRDPAKPKQKVSIVLGECYVQQVIRDNDADVKTSKPIAVSYGSGASGWGASVADGAFEMKMSFAWKEVTSITYEPETEKDGRKHFQLLIKKGSDNSFDLPLFTNDEATVRDLVQRLKKVRQSCGGK